MITVRLGLVTAAQFLTLRFILIGSTQMGCDDPDGPGHAPQYLDVRRENMCWLIQYMKMGKWEPLHRDMCSCAYVKMGGRFIADPAIDELKSIVGIERIKLIWQGRSGKMPKEISVDMNEFLAINSAHRIKEHCSYVIKSRA